MIEYHFQLEDGTRKEFKIALDRCFTPEIDAQAHPQWTRLEYRRCSNCPLANSQFQHCPAAVDVARIIHDFSAMVSFGKTKVWVRTPEREYHHDCDIQKGLNSILGLVMATSGCPILSNLRPLANFHLPFATPEETIFRTVGAYLIKQYFVQEAGGVPDFKLNGLSQLYQDLVELNTCFVGRIREASTKDANINAFIRLDSFSLLVLFAIRDQLVNEKMKFYSGYSTTKQN
ncbi:MAG: hypothetical protein WCO56_26680 [Verrucomicrobiota bacterium]